MKIINDTFNIKGKCTSEVSDICSVSGPPFSKSFAFSTTPPEVPPFPIRGILSKIPLLLMKNSTSQDTISILWYIFSILQYIFILYIISIKLLVYNALSYLIPSCLLKMAPYSTALCCSSVSRLLQY